jgi:hypothetical protein
VHFFPYYPHYGHHTGFDWTALAALALAIVTGWLAFSTASSPERAPPISARSGGPS